MIRVSVLYPNEGRKFDFTYYKETHLPLVRRLLNPYGLVKVEVDKGIGTPQTPAPYIAVGHLIFSSLEEMQKGLRAHDPELAADLVNFTDIQPRFQISEIIV